MMVPENLRKANNNNSLNRKLDCFVELNPPTPIPDRQEEDLVLLEQPQKQQQNNINKNSKKNNNKQRDNETHKAQIRWKRVINLL